MRILLKKPDQHGQRHANAREADIRRPLDSAHRRRNPDPQNIITEAFESKLEKFEKSDDESTSETDSVNSWND